MGALTTHVLDISCGLPAIGMKLELWRLGPGDTRILIQTMHTNSNGRVDSPIISGEEFHSGVYELVFFVASYFRTQGVELAEPPFLDQVPLRFSIANTNMNYHVPLLITPWGYSTYRGS
ncbi:hydroxyisourate hydrolase [Gottfriedia acidiceleris]|uniref:hydroxyisourate hydrolase n=1 Tax=Gottfriedia acidiceleris TaxID=371036 RepID=UPI00101DBF9C|nr:hydroxyisourate hydrolase [Gottfriedia acidiceleris]